MTTTTKVPRLAVTEIPAGYDWQAIITLDSIPLTPTELEAAATTVVIMRADPESLEAAMLRGMLAAWRYDHAALEAEGGEG